MESGGTGYVRRLRARAALRARREWRPLVVLVALVVAGLVLRGLMTYGWRPTFLGYPDSGTYLVLTSNGPLLADSMRTIGYVLFLRAAHALVPHLTAVVALQHLLGVASGVLLYGSVRRATRSPWPGLVPVKRRRA